MRLALFDANDTRIGAAVLVGLALGCGGDDGHADAGADAGTSSDAAATDTDGSETGGPGTATTDTAGDPVPIPAAGGVRRLLAHQYVRSVEHLLGSPAAAAAADALPDDPSLGGFDAVAAAELPLSPTAVERYETTARAVARAALADPSRLAQAVPCITEGPHDATCFEGMSRDFGRLAFRRALTEREVAALVEIGEQARDFADGDFHVGAEYLLGAILQAPSFLYIVEIGEYDDQLGARRLTPNELATRMSFFLLGRTPGAELLALAEAGGLSTEDQIRDVAREMVRRPAARAAVRTFFDELYLLRELPAKGKDLTLFPVYDQALAEAMREETLRLIEHVAFDAGGSFLDILDADYTFVNDALAGIYGLPPPGDWTRVDLPAGQGRAGLLTLSGFLATWAHPDQNSPTRRGLFVQETLLCADVPPPPPDANPTLPEPDDDTTLRQRLEIHMESGVCRSCHVRMDPIGFAFEHFDAIGRRRELDNGFPIDASGEVPDIGSFDDAVELVAILRRDPRVPACLVRNLYTHAVGAFPAEALQAAAFARLDEAFERTDHDLLELMVELTASPLFRLVEAPK